MNLPIVDISKPIDAERLKGGDLESFKEHVRIFAETAEHLLQQKGEKGFCWVCGSTEADKVFAVFGVDFMQCRECSHVYNARIIPDEASYALYETDEDINCHLSDGQYVFRVQQVSGPKADKVLEVRKRLGQSTGQGRWLDVACGGGEMLDARPNAVGTPSVSTSVFPASSP